MSRKPIIAGNWKMNKNNQEAKDFIKAVKDKIPTKDKVDTLVGASNILLEGIIKEAEGSDLQIAGQNCYFEDEGAFTGETSPKTLSELGSSYVIIGHSERRQYFHESDEDVNKKAHAILKNGMLPIICCGESLETYEAGQAEDFVADQVKAALTDLTPGQVEASVLAYEPIWAIGTGKSATVEDAQKMCQVVRNVIAEEFGRDVADAVRIQYGGSVKPNNIKDYMSCPDVDGALVGGASLQADSFLALLEAVK